MSSIPYFSGLGAILLLVVCPALGQEISIWKDAEGVTHIGSPPPPEIQARTLTITPGSPETNFQPQAVPEQAAKAEPPAQAPDPALEENRQRLAAERQQLEKDLYRARARGNRQALIRTRYQLEANTKATEELEHRAKQP